jgi:SAM-dependent methyltransferase
MSDASERAGSASTRPGPLWRSKARGLLPRKVIRLVRPLSTPPPGRVDFGDLRRTRPISGHFGFDRGLPVDRYYIERFLAANSTDIQGRVLEVGDSSYTHQFGDRRVTRADVLHIDPQAPNVTFVADLVDGEGLPSDTFDCIILTQTLHLIFDVSAAVETLHRILAPNGVVLATVPGISQVERGRWRDRWCWSFTTTAAQRTFQAHFAAGDVAVEQHGSVLSAVAFLEGVASQELTESELAAADPAYPVLVAVRAIKGAAE